VELGREHVAAAPVADHGEHDRRLDQHEDDRGHREQDVVEPVDVAALFGDRGERSAS
jgi:hypothetical protein